MTRPYAVVELHLWLFPTEPAHQVTGGFEGVAVQSGRVGFGTPPQRLDGWPLVGRDDDLDSHFVQRLEQLPPRRSRAERLGQVKRSGDDQELHVPTPIQKGLNAKSQRTQRNAKGIKSILKSI